MDAHPEPHASRSLEPVEQPLDAPSQSLAQALRSSFRALKGIMLVLVVLYLVSNVRSLGSHEQALVLRLGRLLPKVHEAGLVWAFPFPIDEIVPLPTRKSNVLLIDSHTFHRRDNEKGKPLSFIARAASEGLHATLDGALLTAESGLAHVQWKVTYKIDDLGKYASTFHGAGVDAAESLLRILVETVGIHVASELNAEELIRTQVDHVQQEMRRRMSERLRELGSGIAVTLVEMYEPTPPLQVRQAFDGTQRAENTKQQNIRAAEKERTKILSEAAGAAYPKLAQILSQIEQSTPADPRTVGLRAELDRVLKEELEGRAGKELKHAGAYRNRVVSQMQSDVERYRTLLPEYQRSPAVLINRLWEETLRQVFESPGVTKLYPPRGLAELRVKIPLDPEETRLQEAERLQKDEFEDSKVRERPRYVPVGPEMD